MPFWGWMRSPEDGGGVALLASAMARRGAAAGGRWRTLAQGRGMWLVVLDPYGRPAKRKGEFPRRVLDGDFRERSVRRPGFVESTFGLLPP